jgi:hypothetical protein
MAIHWSLPLLKEILPEEVYAKLPEIACNPTLGIHSGLYPIINGDTGDMITGVPYTNGLRVPRSKMRAMCSEGIDVQVSCSLSNQCNCYMTLKNISADRICVVRQNPRRCRLQ